GGSGIGGIYPGPALPPAPRGAPPRGLPGVLVGVRFRPTPGPPLGKWGFTLRRRARPSAASSPRPLERARGGALFCFSVFSAGAWGKERIATLTPRGMEELTPGRSRYGLRVAADGRVLGDLTIWRLDAASFEIFSGSDDGLGHLQPPAGSIASVSDLSSETAI